MALDTEQKRGSAMEVSMPWRQWLAEPDGSFNAGDRASLLKLATPTTAVTYVRSHRYALRARRRTYVVIE